MVSRQASSELEAMAELLREPIAILITTAQRTSWIPDNNSEAAKDLAYAQFEPTVAARILQHPRAISLLYLRVAADHLAGLAALFSGGEIFYPVPPLARATVENGARAIHVLDPRTDVRGRCARAWLEELASVHFAHQAVVYAAGRSDETTGTIRRRREELRALVHKTFENVTTDDDPYNWWIEGHKYPRLTEVVDAWTNWRDDDLPGRGQYELLSLYSHPQGFSAREEIQFSEDGDSRIAMDIDLLKRITSAAFAAWFDAFSLVTSYHGYTIPDEALLIDRAARIL